MTALTSAAQIRPRVINGQPSDEAEWPFVVSIHASNKSPVAGHFCGGVLLSSRLVATAAHCVIEIRNHPSMIRVAAGRTTLSDSVGVIAEVEGIMIHPAFEPDTLNFDMALVRLATPVDFPTISLASADEALAAGQGTLLGWGVIDEVQASRADTLQEANIPIINPAECSARLGMAFSPHAMFCGGRLATGPNSQDGVDACYGDSGGPLVIDTPTGKKLRGLVSWGYGCAGNSYYGVYSQAHLMSDWLASGPEVTPFSIRKPKIRGKAKVGKQLKCVDGSWGGDAASSVVQWIDAKRKKKILKDGESFVLKKAHVGRSIMCQVTRTNKGGTTVVRSQKVGPVKF